MRLIKINFGQWPAEQRLGQECIEFWLNSIHFYARNCAGRVIVRYEGICPRCGQWVWSVPLTEQPVVAFEPHERHGC
jgi:hypothetical protein